MRIRRPSRPCCGHWRHCRMPPRQRFGRWFPPCCISWASDFVGRLRRYSPGRSAPRRHVVRGIRTIRNRMPSRRTTLHGRLRGGLRGDLLPAAGKTLCRRGRDGIVGLQAHARSIPASDAGQRPQDRSRRDGDHCCRRRPVSLDGWDPGGAAFIHLMVTYARSAAGGGGFSLWKFVDLSAFSKLLLHRPDAPAWAIPAVGAAIVMVFLWQFSQRKRRRLLRSFDLGDGSHGHAGSEPVCRDL